MDTDMYFAVPPQGSLPKLAEVAEMVQEDLPKHAALTVFTEFGWWQLPVTKPLAQVPEGAP